MEKEKWKDVNIKERWQIINGTVLVFSAIILYFVAFIITLSIGFEVVSAGATLLATGLAFFGISAFVKNQLIDFEAKVNERIKKFEDEESKRRNDEEE